jgi:hypothetical protein
MKDNNDRSALSSSSTTMSGGVVFLLVVTLMIGSVSSFTIPDIRKVVQQQQRSPGRKRTIGTSSILPHDSMTTISIKAVLFATSSNRQQQLSSLPKDISPFEKSASKGRDVQGEFRKMAETALNRALLDGKVQLEIEFPPLLGGDKSKSQFDDFDNVQELNMNRDWCVQLLPTLGISAALKATKGTSGNTNSIWFILPDLKEVELCKEEWKGQRYQQAATYTSIEAVAAHYCGNSKTKSDEAAEGYSTPWGATFASVVNNLLKGGGVDGASGGGGGGSGLLGDQDALDSLDDTSACLHLVCQPGNGGPVEDWINVKVLHENSASKIGGTQTIPTCIVNGALDKVRDGYYAPFIFPKLAKTFDFYRSFEQVFFLKPVSDKSVYGWLFRVYPEPWQVVLQQPVRNPKTDALVVEDTVALVSDTRPTYSQCVQALVSTAAATAVPKKK